MAKKSKVRAEKKNTLCANGKQVAYNKKARFNYEILNTYEAGIELQGSEVKYLRMHSLDMSDGYANFHKGELFLKNLNIGILPSFQGRAHEERRDRRLLLRKSELSQLSKNLIKGFSIVPLSLRFNIRGYVKVDIALAKGKKEFDKRRTIKERDQKLEARREAAQSGERF